MKRITQITALAVLLAFGHALSAAAAVNVVCTHATLADLARSIGGNKVSISCLSKGTQDPHTVEPRPSQVVQLSHADLFVRIGMDLDMWADSLQAASRNSKIAKGAPGDVDASAGIRKLEVPSGRLDPSMGDIHIYGNPHYWLDPENGLRVAYNIMNGLIRVDPGSADYYKANYKELYRAIKAKEAVWMKQMAPVQGAKIVSYHRTWPYFLRRFGLESAGELEPKPGIPPSPSHIAELANRMKQEHVRVILLERFYPTRFADLLAKQSGAKVVRVPVSVGGAPGINNYVELMNNIVDQLSRELR